MAFSTFEIKGIVHQFFSIVQISYFVIVMGCGVNDRKKIVNNPFNNQLLKQLFANPSSDTCYFFKAFSPMSTEEDRF